MSANSRFAVAIHVLGMLAYKQPEMLTSAYIACSVTTNPVVIRRVLGDLRRAGLVLSKAGGRGGWRLQRAAENITLRDAYLAVRETALFAAPAQRPDPNCAIGSVIENTLRQLFAEAENVLEQHLRQVTLADVLTQFKAQGCPLSSRET